MPKVSICIPCYNNPGDVERLLNSIREQSFTDYEVIISDDSTDKRIADLVRSMYPAEASEGKLAFISPEPLNKDCGNTEKVGKDSADKTGDSVHSSSSTVQLRSESGKVTYVHNGKALGVVLNWNAAIRRARGEYIKIMFSDDWFTGPQSLADYIAMLDEHPEADLAFSGSRQCHIDGRRAGGSQADGRHSDTDRGTDYERAASDDFIRRLQLDYRTLFCSNQIGAPSAVIYRRCPSSGSDCPLFDEESGFASDVFLYMEILSRNPVFVSTKDPLVSIGLHERQYTETFEEKDPGKYQDYRLLYQKYELWKFPEYQRYFLKEYLIPYHKGIDEARQLHIPDSLYRQEVRNERRETLRSFIQAKKNDLRLSSFF